VRGYRSGAPHTWSACRTGGQGTYRLKAPVNTQPCRTRQAQALSTKEKPLWATTDVRAAVTPWSSPAFASYGFVWGCHDLPNDAGRRHGVPLIAAGLPTVFLGEVGDGRHLVFTCPALSILAVVTGIHLGLGHPQFVANRMTASICLSVRHGLFRLLADSQFSI
jgi:hypothetical protein